MSVPKSSEFLYNSDDYTIKHKAAFAALAAEFQRENEGRTDLLPPNVPKVFYTKQQVLKFAGVFDGSQMGLASPEVARKGAKKLAVKTHKVAQEAFRAGIFTVRKPINSAIQEGIRRRGLRYHAANKDLPKEILPPTVPLAFYTARQFNLFETTAKTFLKINKKQRPESAGAPPSPVASAAAKKVGDPSTPLATAAVTIDKVAETHLARPPSPQLETPLDVATASRVSSDDLTRPVELDSIIADDASPIAQPPAPVRDEPRSASPLLATPSVVAQPPVDTTPRARFEEGVPAAALDTPLAPPRDDGTVQAVLNRIDDNPTATATGTTFEVNFGGVTKELGYALRHNSVAAGVKPSDLAQLSGQTRLLLQQVYRFYEDKLTEDDTAPLNLTDAFKFVVLEDDTPPFLSTPAFQLAVLQDITSYNIKFDADENTVTLEIHDSKNHTFSHEFAESIDGDPDTDGFEVKTYLTNSKHIVETALKNDKTFANNSGRTFFLKYVEAGGTFPREEKKSESSNELSTEQRNGLYQEFMARAQQDAIQRQEQEMHRRAEAERRAAAT